MKEYNDKFQAIYESSPDAIMLLDEHGFIDCNPATLKIFACSSAEEFLDRHPSVYSPPTQPGGIDSKSSADEKIKTAYSTGSNLFEWMHKRANGEVFPAEVQLTLLKLKGGDVLQATVKDITSKKIAETKLSDAYNELESSAFLLQNIIESVPVRVFWKDQNLHYLGCNTLFASDAGFSNPNQLIGKTDYDMGWKDQADLYREDDKATMVAATPKLNFEEPQTTPDGEDICLLTSKVPLRDSNHEVIGVLGIYDDITERKNAEKKLHESEEKYRGIFDESVATIYVFDQNKNFTGSNQAGLDLLGYSREGLLKMSIPDVDADHGKFVKHLLSGGRVINFEHRLVHKDGHIITVLNNSRHLIGPDGEVIGMQSTLLDITEQKKLEEQLLQSQKMEAIGTLVGGIAHDFNNTLAAIKANIYLARRANTEGVLHTKLDDIDQLSSHAAKTVKQLLTFARKDRVTTRPFSLTHFMKEESKLSKSILPENINYTVNLCHEDLIIDGDSNQIEQALFNLLGNARDAVSHVRQPQISCTLESFDTNADFQQRYPKFMGKLAHLMVKDNGCGISKDDLEQIFIPFFTTKSVDKGTGLGLAMVYGSVQTHEGVIEVDSFVGQGTTFHIYLPLSRNSWRDIDKQENFIAAGEDETILFVDDEAYMRTAVGDALSGMGYNILLAEDGEHAVELFKANADNISLVISDLVMPKMGGVDAVKKMRLLNSEVPVIFTTGYDKKQSATSYEDIKKSIAISKPFSFELLSHSIRKFIASSE